MVPKTAQAVRKLSREKGANVFEVGSVFGPPEGLERHLDAARQKLPQDSFSRSIAAQLPPPRGQFWKRKKSPLLWGRGILGGILRGNLGEGNCESRQWGVNFCREASRCLAGPSGPLFGSKTPRNAPKKAQKAIHSSQNWPWKIAENYLGDASLLTVGAFLLTVKLLCLQSLKALIRRTFPL